MTHNGSGPNLDGGRQGGARKMDLLDGKIDFQNSAPATPTQATAVTIVIAGPPTAKGRPRMTRRGIAYTPAPRMTRRGIAYTPAATRKYEAHGRLAAQQAMDGRPPIAVPVRAEVVIDLPVLASWFAKRRNAALRGDVRPTLRLDTDNYVKAALDAINAIVVTDDSLVVELAAAKRYALVPQLEITITPLPATAANARNI